MKPSRVRDLARRYAAGELSLDEYRAQRRKLIDGVTAGEQKLDYGEASVSQRKQPRLRRFSIIGVVVMVIGIAAFLWVEHSHESYLRKTQTRVVPETGPALVRTFIETNNWSDASLGQFLQNWKALPSHEQKAARGSYLFPRLLSQLREQIVSQQAVVDLAAGTDNDADSASAHLAHLQKLAVTLRVKQEH